MKFRIIFSGLLFLMAPASAEVTEHSDLFYGTVSENFVIRWAYQKICHHTFDPRTNEFMWPTKPGGATFNPDAVKPGDLIFVRDICAFMKSLHPHIKHPYIMVTAGEFRDQVKKPFIDFLDDPKVIAWFSVHPCKRTHPKFYMLPLGIYQDKKSYLKRAELTELFTQLRHMPKNKLLYSNFFDIKGGKPERARVVDLFENAPFCYRAVKRIPFLDYMKEMAQFKFSLSPKGYGPDSYRNWEAMLVGSIPIVMTSHVDPLYDGLPVLIINNWNEVTEEFLEKKYEEMKAKKYNIEKLCSEYWWAKINKIRDDFLKNYKA